MRYIKRLLIATILFSQHIFAAENTLLECRQIVNADERLVCYDGISDPLIVTEAFHKDLIARKVGPLDDTTAFPGALDEESLFGKGETEAKRIVEKSLNIKPLEQIQAKIINVEKTAHKKLIIVLDNGQVWRQIDNQPMPLKSGELVIIRAAKLRSYFLQKQSGSGSIRVKRLN